MRGFRNVTDILGPFVGSEQHLRFEHLAGHIQRHGSGDALIEAIDALISLRLHEASLGKLQPDTLPLRMDIARQHLAYGGNPHTGRMDAVEHRLREALSNAPFNSDERRAMIQQVEQLNKRLGYAKATEAIRAGHYPQYEVLLATWDMLYGPFGKTTDETRERPPAEHSGETPVSHETGRDGLDGRPSESEGRGDAETSGSTSDGGSGDT